MAVLGMVTDNWELIVAVIAAAFGVGVSLRNRQWSKAAEALAYLGHIAYSAIDEAHDQTGSEDVKGIKTRVSDAVTKMAGAVPALTEAEGVVMARVDPDPAVPPVKRFWRRFLAGENFAGVAARVAARAALDKITR